jgi:hypothetical protein
MTPHGKLAVILFVWLGLIVFTFLYFYFCEWRLFPNKNRLKEMEKSNFGFDECAEDGDSKLKLRHRNVNLFLFLSNHGRQI